MSAAEDLVAQAADVHHGLRVLELGEDGETLVVLGHHDDRRTLAALNRFARTTWGTDSVAGDLPDPGDGELVRRELHRLRAIVVHACALGLNVDDDDPRPAGQLERVTTASPTCPDCAAIGAPWALTWPDDAQDAPDAFPITVWEVNG